MIALWRLTFLFASLVCVLSQTVDPKLSYFYGAGASYAQAGSPSFFYIQPVDSTGKNVTTCSVTFRILLTRPGSTTPIPGTTVSCDPTTGAYQSSYVVRVATTWTMNVTYQNTLLKNGSVPVTAVAGPVSGPNSPASGSGLDGGIVGVQHYFNVTAYDAYDNRNYSCLAGNSDWQILIKGGPNKNYNGSLDHCNNGIYTLKYEANYTGQYQISVLVTGNPTINSPYSVYLSAGPIDAKHTTAEGTGLTSSTAGQFAPIIIKVRDEYNNDIDTCLNSSDYKNFLIVLAFGNVRVDGYITGCNNGIYTATYNATVAGTYSLSIKYLGVDIENSPFNPVVSPGDISGSTSIVQGTGLTAAIAGIPALFIVIPYDQFKNPIKSCTARFSDFVTQLHYLNGSSKYDVTGRVTGCLSPWFNYTISYVATKRGSYSLTVQYKGQPLNKSPYFPFVESGALSPPNTNATGALYYAEVGQKEVVIVHAYDSYDNKIYQCDQQFSKWTVVLNNQIYGSVIDCKEGNYTAVYEVTKINNYILEIEFVGNPIEGSPYFIQALPGPPDPAHCTMTGEGLSIAYAGSKANFTVACSDKYDNPITQCFFEKNWNFTLTGPAFYTGTAVSCNNQTQEIAKYYFEYVAFISGRYVLHVTYTNITLPDHNPKVFPGPVDAPSSYAEGPGVSIDPSNLAGSPVTFRIISKDKYNNTIDSSCPNPANWQITLTPSVTVPPVVTCTSDFQTIVTYTANTARVYQVDIRYSGVPIRKNPYTAQIFAGPIDASSSRAQGEALTYGIAGEQHIFWIVTYDKYGNAIQQCTASITDFQVILSGPNYMSLDDSIFNCTRGIYYGSYDAYKAGTYTLQLTYKSNPVDKSPYHPLIVPADIYGPNCVATGPGLLDTPAGVTTYITLFCEDRYNNPITVCRNDTISNGYWKTSTSGGNFYFQAVKCYPGGNYEFDFYATKVGVWDLVITYKNQSIRGSPLPIHVVAGPIDPPSTTALSGVTTARVGETTTIQVQGKDRYGNINGTCFDNKHWGVAFRDNTVVIYVSCQNNLWYWQYTPTKIGKKVLDINFTDTNLPTRPIQNSPFVVDVIAGPIAANNTFAVGQGLSSATAGVVAVFYVYVVDEYGNNITVCEDLSAWSVTLTGPDSPPVNFSCNSAPPYVGRYIAYKKGTHTLSIRYSNTHIHGSPFLPLVVPGPIYNGTSYAQGPATTIGAAGVLETFQIVAVDRYQNLIDTCDNSTFSKWRVQLIHEGDGKSFNGYVDGCNGGSYIAHYRTTLAGTYKLWVYWNSDNTLYSPFTLIITAGNVNASHSIAYGPGVNNTLDIIAGSITTFHIKTFDSYDNPVTTCIGDYRSYWNVTLRLPNNVTLRVDVNDCNSGIYDVSYNVTVAGQVIIYVHGNNVPTIGSPYYVNVIAGDADPLHSLIKKPVPSGDAGQQLMLELELYDIFGNPVKKCSLDKNNFDVYFADGSGNIYRFNISNCQSGTYQVSFTLYNPGQYYAHAKYRNQEIKNSPQIVIISEGGVVARYSYADGRGVNAQDIVAGTEATFFIHSVNQYNVTLRSNAACVNFAFWQVTSKPAVTHGFDFVDCTQGVYTVKYNATVATVYEITITLNGSNILYNPYRPQVISGPPYPPNTVVTGDEVNKPTAHDSGNFTIQVRDVYGNDVTDTSKYDFRAVLTPECVNASVTCHNLNDGRYNCLYSLEEGGVYCISVEYNGVIIPLTESYRLNALGGKGCKNSCNHNGLCLSKQCYCLSKYTTDDCGKKISSKYMSIAAAIGIIIGVGIFLLIVGILIGVFVIRRFRRGPDNQPLLA